MLEKEFEYFRSNQEDLVEKYRGKFVVIQGKKVIGIFDSELEAYTETIEEYEPGTFLIQECLPGEEAYTHTFYSRVVVN